MTKETSTAVEPPRRRTAKDRRRQAAYSAAHRERTAGVPEMRVIDRTLVEALGAFLETAPLSLTATVMPAVVGLAVSGLVHAGIDERTAKRAIGTRLQYWRTTKPRGLVKPARDRASATKLDLTP